MEFENDLTKVLDKTFNKKMNNIAIFVSAYSRFEGASRVAEQQAREFIESERSVSIFTFRADMNTPQGINLEMVKPSFPLNEFLFKIYRGLFPLNIIKMTRYIRKFRYFDLIIVHHSNWLFLGYIIKKLYGTRIVFCLHNIERPRISIYSINQIPENVYSLLIFYMQKWIMKNIDSIISVSKHSAENLKRTTGLSSIVLYNTIDINRFKQVSDENFIRNKLSIKDEPIILYVGRVIHRKGIHTLIESFKIIKQIIPNTKLIIVGKHYDKRYTEKLKEMSDESVIFMENVDDNELPYYYATCDVYATCSQSEGFNLPLVEAQTCGKEVVAFDIGAHRENLKRGFLVKNGNLEEFSDCLISIIAKSIEKREKGQYNEKHENLIYTSI